MYHSRELAQFALPTSGRNYELTQSKANEKPKDDEEPVLLQEGTDEGEPANHAARTEQHFSTAELVRQDPEHDVSEEPSHEHHGVRKGGHPIRITHQVPLRTCQKLNNDLLISC